MADKEDIKMNKQAVGLRPYVINIILVVLFAFCIISFSIGFVQETNPDSEILDGRFNSSLTSLDSTINNFSDIAHSINATLAGSKPTATDYLFLMFKGAFFIPLRFLSLVASGIVLVVNVLFLSFGGTMFGGVILSLLSLITAGALITIVLLIIKTIRTGESER
jgi:hypothetical protein